MSDSLKDQLLKAGFSEPTTKARKKKPSGSRANKSKRHRSNNDGGHGKATEPLIHPATAQAQESQEIIRRREIKAKIKALIDTASIKEFNGDQVFRFTLQNRIRELHFREDIRAQVISGALVITRLNGSTHLVPAAVAQEIKTLNPDWAIVTPGNDDSIDANGDYDSYPVPDDLIW